MGICNEKYFWVLSEELHEACERQQKRVIQHVSVHSVESSITAEIKDWAINYKQSREQIEFSGFPFLGIYASCKIEFQIECIICLFEHEMESFASD